MLGVSQNDFIYHKKSAFTQKECDFFIELFETRPEFQFKGMVTNTKRGSVLDKEKKISTEIVLRYDDWPFLHPLEQVVKEYKEKYPSTSNLCPWGIWSTYKMQRYLPGEGYFFVHCENTGPQQGNPDTFKRMMAWMVYLNDVTEGGHTNFPAQKRKFQPRRGDVLLWPAYFTHPHHGIVSKTQTKYILTGWYSFV